MVFTVATILDVICTITFFFTKQSGKLSTENKSQVHQQNLNHSIYMCVCTKHFMCMYLCMCIYIHKIQFQPRRYLVREKGKIKGFILAETKNIPPHLLIAIFLKLYTWFKINFLSISNKDRDSCML